MSYLSMIEALEWFGGWFPMIAFIGGFFYLGINSNIKGAIASGVMAVVFGTIAIFAFFYTATHTFIKPTELALLHNLRTGELVSVVDDEGNYRSGIIEHGYWDEIIRFDATLQRIRFNDSVTDVNSPYRAISVRDENLLSILFDIDVEWRIDPIKLPQVYTQFGNDMDRMQNYVAEHARSVIPVNFQTLGLNTGDLASVDLNEDGEVVSTDEDGQEAALQTMSTNFTTALSDDLAESGFVIAGVYIRNSNLDDGWEERVRARNVAQQDLAVAQEENAAALEREQGQTALQNERNERNADQVRVEAQAQADAVGIEAEAEAERIRVIANAEAEAARIQIEACVQAYGSTQACLEALQYETFNPNVSLIITEDGMIPVIQVDDGTGNTTVVPIYEEDADNIPENPTIVPTGQP